MALLVLITGENWVKCGLGKALGSPTLWARLIQGGKGIKFADKAAYVLQLLPTLLPLLGDPFVSRTYESCLLNVLDHAPKALETFGQAASAFVRHAVCNNEQGFLLFVRQGHGVGPQPPADRHDRAHATNETTQTDAR